MNRAAIIPPLAPDDRLPHSAAVWRDYADDGQHRFDPPAGANGRKVSIEYDDGMIIIAWAHRANWCGAKRWRFGWPPA